MTTPTLCGPTRDTPALLGPTFTVPADAGNNPNPGDEELLERLELLNELPVLVLLLERLEVEELLSVDVDEDDSLDALDRLL